MSGNLELARLLTVGKVASSPSWGTAAGAHRNHELVVVNKGTMHLRVGHTDYRATTGDILFYAAGTEHEEHSDLHDPPELYFIAFELQDYPRQHAVCVRDFDGRLRQVVYWLYEEWPNHAVLRRELCDAYFRALLMEWHVLQIATEPPLVARVRRRIRGAIDDHIDLETLARVAGLSKYHFLRTYKKLAGRTPMEEVRIERVRFAQQLIASTDLPMKDVAARAGLCDEYHLGHLLKRYLNVTPGEIRSTRHQALGDNPPPRRSTA